MRKIIDNFMQIAKYLRVGEWIHFVGLACLGYFLNAGHFTINQNFLPMLLFSASGLAFAYSFDLYFDSRGAYRQPYLLISLAFMLVSLILSFAVSLSTFFIVIFGNLLVIFYSYPAVGLKSKRFAAAFVNPLTFMLLFAAGFFAYGDASSYLLLFAIPVPVLLVAAQILHELEHEKYDVKTGLKTVAVELGRHNSLIIIKLALALAVLWSVISYTIYGRVLIPVFTFAFASFSIVILNKKTEPAVQRLAIRYAGIVYGAALLFSIL